MTPNKIRIVTITILLYNHKEGKMQALRTMNNSYYKQSKMMNHNVIQVKLIPADCIPE